MPFKTLQNEQDLIKMRINEGISEGISERIKKK